MDNQEKLIRKTDSGRGRETGVREKAENRKKAAGKRSVQTLRLWVQALWTALTNGYAYGFLKGRIYTGKSKTLCVPGLNCYSCPGALFSCPIGSLQAVLDSRKFAFSCYLFGMLMVFGSIFGRLICGWLCPFGLVQDLLYRIPLFRKVKRIPGDAWLRWMKYVILAVFVILLPSVVVNVAGFGSPWFCEYICPSGTLMGGLPLLLTNPGLRAAAGVLFSWKAFLLAAVVLVSIKMPRPFCRYICPLGAIYGLFNPVAFYRLRVDEKKCISCGKCRTVCPMDIKVWKHPNSLECIRCGACKESCPTGAIESTAAGFLTGKHRAGTHKEQTEIRR